MNLITGLHPVLEYGALSGLFLSKTPKLALKGRNKLAQGGAL
jgi:hypothetical protein